VPIDPEKCESFDPFSVPTLESLLKELDSDNTMEQDSDSVKDYEKTSLKPHVEYFKSFLSGLSEEIRSSLRTKRAEEERKLMF
jgi:DNA primase small subunit